MLKVETAASQEHAKVGASFGKRYDVYNEECDFNGEEFSFFPMIDGA